MDRDRIERKDFSASRRGYDRDEVDAHLRAVADELERRERSSGERLADPAGDQVRDVIAAAERSAAAIRERAEAEAAEHVKRVRRATGKLLTETAAAQSELEAALEGLRGGGEPPEASARGDEPARVEVVGEEEEELPAGETPDEFEVDEGEPAAKREGDRPPSPADAEISAAEPAERVEEPAEEPEASGPARALAGSEGARLIALNMALNGTPREEAARYLADNFDIEDQEAILDDVYSRAGA